MTDLRAVVFDVDGTLADTERDGHRPAFNAAFAAHGLDIRWAPEEYGRLLQVAGGRERIAHDLRARGHGDAADRLAPRIHATKTQLFCEAVRDGSIQARPGVLDLISGLRAAGIRIAVATTGRRAWVRPLIDGLLGGEVAEVVVTGDDVGRLKPDPEVYLRTLRQLGVEPRQVLAVEDSAIGLQSAATAGIATVVVSNDYTAGQDFSRAAAVHRNFDGCHGNGDPLRVDDVRRVHATWWRAHAPAG